jgi:hypothetical protein
MSREAERLGAGAIMGENGSGKKKAYDSVRRNTKD